MPSDEQTAEERRHDAQMLAEADQAMAAAEHAEVIRESISPCPEADVQAQIAGNHDTDLSGPGFTGRFHIEGRRV